jgi:hypothetical protein
MSGLGGLVSRVKKWNIAEELNGADRLAKVTTQNLVPNLLVMCEI